MKTVDLHGVPCVRISNGVLTLLVSKSVGPRVLSLQMHDSENLFAELPGLSLECPGAGDFHFYGGHRLWYAPEEPARTYLPDNDPIEIKQAG
jgi:hypothetical protein